MTKYYDKVAKSYHSFMNDPKNFFNNYVEQPRTLEKLSEINFEGKKVLDLGCGSGRFVKFFLSKTAEVIGVDPSVEQLKIAEKEFPEVDFRLGGAGKIPCSDNEFDFVFAGMAVDYFDDLSKAFKEINRVLKKGGRVVFTGHVPYLVVANSVKIDGKKYFEFDHYFKEGMRKRRWTSLNIEMPYYHFTFETMFKSILNNGFSVVDYRDLYPIAEGEKIDPADYNETVNKSKFYLMELVKN